MQVERSVKQDSGTETIRLTTSLSTLAEKLFMLNGQPFSLDDYPMHRQIYDGRYDSTLLMTGRQVAKSTSLATFIIGESIAIPYFNSYYVSPSKEQTTTFSHLRVGAVLRQSPLVKKYFQSPASADRVLMREYTNGSVNAFTYAKTNADRARGFSASRCLFDECQDMVIADVAPVITATMRNSKYRYELYAGTPKTMENGIQWLWEQSSQSEWAMKCTGCNRYNIAVDVKIIGKTGPICLNCGKLLNPRAGQWVDMAPPNHPTMPGKHIIKGLHIPQPILPENIASCMQNTELKPRAVEDAEARWTKILTDMELHSESMFKNEVMGVSDAIGQRLISKEELEALCTGPSISPAPGPNFTGVSQTVAGVDWSGGGSDGRSRTVLWIWGWVGAEQKLRTLYYRVYPGQHPERVVDDIVTVCENYRVGMCIGDAGVGHLANSTVRTRLGAHRATQAEYCSQAKPMVWNGVDKYRIDKTTMVDNYLALVKRGGITLPPLPEAKEAIKDVLSVYEEVTRGGKKIWQHSPNTPDDALHAQIFGWLAWKVLSGDVKFYA